MPPAKSDQDVIRWWQLCWRLCWKTTFQDPLPDRMCALGTHYHQCRAPLSQVIRGAGECTLWSTRPSRCVGCSRVCGHGVQRTRRCAVSMQNARARSHAWPCAGGDGTGQGDPEATTRRVVGVLGDLSLLTGSTVLLVIS